MIAAPEREAVTPADVQNRLERAREAQRGWACVPVAERLLVVRRFRQLVAGRAAELARTVTHAQRRSPAETLSAELLPLVAACRFLERRARRLLRPRRTDLGRRPLWLPRTRVEIRREPFGVVLVIGPSNYPLLLPGVQALQALVAGNAVWIKPGAGGTAAARALADLFGEAGAPEHLLTVLPEMVEAAREAIAAGVDKILLTGSLATGREVLRQAAERPIPVVAELSGADPVFVRAEADLALVVAALRFGLLLNGGATCIAPRRVFVHRSLAAPLEQELRRVLADEPAVPLPPVAARRAAELVADALSRGGRLAAGGLPDAFGMRPTVVAGATAAMELAHDEVVGPLLALYEVADDDDALRLADRSRYALGASVFGEPRAACALASRVRAGVVVVNDLIVPTADPRIPFGGRGASGFGVTRGAEGLLELTAPRALVVRRGRRMPRHLRPTPGERLFESWLAAAHGASWRARLAGLVALAREVLSMAGRSGRPNGGDA